MNILAIDLGYSNVKVCLYNDSGALQFDKYISAVAKVDNPMEMDDKLMFSLGPDTYVMGASALKLSRNLLMKLETFEDMKVLYPVWVSYLLSIYGNKFDHVVLGLSMAFSDRADELLKYLYDTLLIQRENYFLVLPQGLSCKLAYNEKGLDIHDTSTGAAGENRLLDYIICDGGFNTVDFATVINGSASAGATLGIPNSGVCLLCYDILDYLFKKYEMKISLKDAQNYLDSKGIFIRRGKRYDISKEVKEFTKKYLGYVFQLLEDKYGDYIDASSGIIIVGGLANIINEYSKDPDVVAEIEKHFPISFLHWPKFDGEFYNAFSYLKAAEKLIEE